MAWSIFSQGGGQGAAVTWAEDLLARLGLPPNVQKDPGAIQFVYDWELSEGGGGLYNPLNQGPVPGHPELTSTGPQYGGGAADFVSWQAGLTGAVDYLNMPNFEPILASLKADDPVGARAALIASPWAKSHYSGGSHFATAPLPGKGSALANFQPTANPDGSVTSVPTTTAYTTSFLGDVESGLGDIAPLFAGFDLLGSGVSDVGKIAKELGMFFSAILAGSTWVRIGEAVLGVLMLSGGIALLVIILATSPGGQGVIGSMASLIPGEGTAAKLGAKVASSAGSKASAAYSRRARSQATVTRSRATRTRAKAAGVRAATAHTRARTAQQRATTANVRAAQAHKRATAKPARERRPDRDDRRAAAATRTGRANRAAYRRHMDTSDLRRRTA